MEQSLSYSSQLKQQIIISDIKSKCCASAELSALILMNGESNFRLKDKNLIRRINGLASKTRSLGIEKRVYFYRNKKNSTFYGVEVYHGNSAVYNEEQSKFCCSNSFLRGCFLYSGYIASPDKPARAEIAFKNSLAAEICKKQLYQCGIPYNVTKRNDREIVYIKSTNGISDFLAHIGAVGAMLEFENRNIIKKGNSDANRMMNCDNANLDKSVAAAARQTALLSAFIKTATFETLPEQLKEIAILRVENESLSLKELGMLLVPVLSKSGVAHRLKKLEEMAGHANINQ